MEKETLRDELRSDPDEVVECRDVLGVEDAREASSRESRGRCEDGGWRFE